MSVFPSLEYTLVVTSGCKDDFHGSGVLHGTSVVVVTKIYCNTHVDVCAGLRILCIHLKTHPEIPQNGGPLHLMFGNGMGRVDSGSQAGLKLV